jgi:bifunctional UDP-N-acetylglucosamine pyrophosphorylase/glucosamine-1-phosphate N-acetyltransferase
MWWRELEAQSHGWPAADDSAAVLDVAPSAEIAETAILDTSSGPITIGDHTRICPGAYVQGPVTIGKDCLVGNLAVVRGATTIGDGTRIGYAAEIKHAIIEEQVTIGPQCFVADSKIERDAYLGAQVRTSNHRLDKGTIKVRVGDDWHDTGLEKLGCLIGSGAALGIQVIILPGRVVAPGSMFAPRSTVEETCRPAATGLSNNLKRFERDSHEVRYDQRLAAPVRRRARPGPAAPRHAENPGFRGRGAS